MIFAVSLQRQLEAGWAPRGALQITVMLELQSRRGSQELVEKRCEHSSRVLELEWLLDVVMAQIKEKQEQSVVEFLVVRLHPPLVGLGTPTWHPAHAVPAVGWGPEGREGWDEVWVTSSPPNLLHTAGQPLQLPWQRQGSPVFSLF